MRGWHRPMAFFAGASMAFSVVCVVALVVDQRVLLGAPIWMKPLKFALSMTAYCVTWSWLYSMLDRGRRFAWVVSTGIVACFVIEYVIIVGQVVRGRASHFNTATPLDAALWQTMAVTIALLWLGTLALTAQVLAAPIADRASRLAIRLGTVISLVDIGLGALMTVDPERHAAGAAIGLAGGAHSVGVPDGGPGMPVTGWSTVGGDLRIPHFVGIHALQALPLLAMALGALATRWSPLGPVRTRARLVLIAGIGYAGLVALATWQAERGQSLVHPDTTTLAALGALVAGCAAAAWLTLLHSDDRELVAA